MSQAMDKLKRVKPLLRARAAQLNSEAQKLHFLRDLKHSALGDLKRSQEEYIQAVEKINLQRQSNQRTMLLTLENSVDTIKARFYQSLKKVRELEQRERNQMTRVLEAERNLQSAEKLQDRYQEVVKKDLGVKEQHRLDEIALKRHWDNL